MIRVLVVDDHPSVRENLRYLVNAERDIAAGIQTCRPDACSDGSRAEHRASR